MMTQSAASADERDDEEDGAGTSRDMPSQMEIIAARQAQAQAHHDRAAPGHEGAASGQSLWVGIIATVVAVASAIAVWMVS